MLRHASRQGSELRDSRGRGKSGGRGGGDANGNSHPENFSQLALSSSFSSSSEWFLCRSLESLREEEEEEEEFLEVAAREKRRRRKFEFKFFLLLEMKIEFFLFPFFQLTAQTRKLQISPQRANFQYFSNFHRTRVQFSVAAFEGNENSEEEENFFNLLRKKSN